LCIECINGIESVELEVFKNIDGVKLYSRGKYGGNLRKIIRAIKYHGKKDLAKILATQLYGLYQEIGYADKNIEIIPVPLHKKRQKDRNYNHMELISNELSKISGFATNKKLIKRVKDTRPQYKLNFKQRKENLTNAFEIDKSNYNNTSVLIIDDIATTGATIAEMIKELRKNGINDIKAIVISASMGEKYL
jgi:ComF family protein